MDASVEIFDPIENDPVHDIDGKKTAIWLAFWVVLLLGSLWLMLQVYNYKLSQEKRAIEAVPNPVTVMLMEQELMILAGGIEGPGGMKIEEAMAMVATGARPSKHQ